MTLASLRNRAIQWNSAAMAAAFVTFLLFYFMQYLISTDNSSFREPSITRLIDATMPVIEPPALLEIAKPEPIEQIETPVLDTPALDFAQGDNYGAVLVFEPPVMPTSGDASIPLSRHMVPLVRATAPYPTRALRRGIEGFVELSFTVNESGKVVDPIVLYAEPEGFFERSALTSISKWQYSPAMDDGVAIPVYDVRQRIVFEIDGN